METIWNRNPKRIVHSQPRQTPHQVIKTVENVQNVTPLQVIKRIKSVENVQNITPLQVIKTFENIQNVTTNVQNVNDYCVGHKGNRPYTSAVPVQLIQPTSQSYVPVPVRVALQARIQSPSDIDPRGESRNQSTSDIDPRIASVVRTLQMNKSTP